MAPGPYTLGPRRDELTGPRVRAFDRSGELLLRSCDLFSPAGVFGRLAVRMLAGLWSRRYGAGLEPAGRAVEEEGGRGHAEVGGVAPVRRAAVPALESLVSRRLDDPDLAVPVIDSVHFGERTCVVALGIGVDGTRYPLAAGEGSTENATLATGLRGRGLDVTPPVLPQLALSGLTTTQASLLHPGDAGRAMAGPSDPRSRFLRLMPECSAPKPTTTTGVVSIDRGHPLGHLRLLLTARVGPEVRHGIPEQEGGAMLSKLGMRHCCPRRRHRRRPVRRRSGR